jgi:transposase
MSTNLPTSVTPASTAATSAPVAAATSPTPDALLQADLLPDDLALLKRMIVNLVQMLRDSRQQNEGLRGRLDELLHKLLRLPREHWDPKQPLLFPELAAALGLTSPETPEASEATTAVDADAADDKTTKKAKKRGKPHGRGVLPDHLERVPVDHSLSDAERACPCCHHPRDVLGTQTNEQLDYRPAVLFVNQHNRFTYICRTCSKGAPASDRPLSVVEAGPAVEAGTTPMVAENAAALAGLPVELTNLEEMALVSPPAASPTHTLIRSPRVVGPIDRGLPGFGLLAYLIVSKFNDHLPLYRLETMLARMGAEVARSSMCDWLAASAELLQPLMDRMTARILQSLVIHTDDTPVPLRDASRDKHLISRLWIYWGDRFNPYTVFDYTRTRKRDGPDGFLQDFHGYLQADGYSAYDAIYLDPKRGIREVACWAHALRKFRDVLPKEPERVTAALAFIGRLYDVEDEAIALAAGDAGRLEAERLRLRQSVSKPLLETFRSWLVVQRDDVLPKHELSAAIQYVLNSWDAFVRYTENGALAIDNNVSERALKQVALGRKNYMFFGAEAGGQTAAALYSVVATCTRHRIDPWRYLVDVLKCLAENRDALRQAKKADDPATLARLLDPLLPDIWKQAHPEAHVPDVHNTGRR